ncbi:putative bifunctional diguanylate cyclase/phosphodiesterase [Rubellimicrobium arenae]|uniref:putative bifunctional diguanylate cyclase/phosphodiesterase n=1 Tax=Rubellimicrobium arenae TaxID=2817372 RepID=UPI001B30B0AB|nr:bifunctional diguanylate cyclase/phosphodiesterase [Rubellimicrobium arenae]
MAGTIILFVLTLAFALLWTTRTLDSQAADQSMVQMRNEQDDMLARARMITLDYTKWDAAVSALAVRDFDWIYDNIGSTATIGRAVQLVVLSGGPVRGDIGWTDAGGGRETTGLLSQGILDAVGRRLADVPDDSYGGIDFFGWSDGSLYALGASRFEPVDNVISLPDGATDFGFLVMGIRLTDDMLDDTARSFLLKDLRIVRSVAPWQMGLPLRGQDGEPVAYLAWDRPFPGGDALHQLMPVLGVVMALTVCLAVLGLLLVRRSAQHLLEAKRRASVAALTDALTGLPNRAAFNEMIARPSCAGGRSIVFLDINGFKRINDSIGHAAGDQVIACIARRLSRLGAPGTFLARISGDEFVFVVTGPDIEHRTSRLLSAIESRLSEPFSILGHRMLLQAAVGYAVQEVDDLPGDDLVRHADLAMYEAKRQNSRVAVAFSSMIGQASIDATRIEQGLRSALATRGELSVAYQPITGTDGRFVRAEALARWSSPEFGIVSPSRFIAVAEQAGLMIELGRRLLTLIRDDLVAHPDLRVSVNISPLQLVVPDFVPDLLHDLSIRGIGPDRIQVELTESVLVKDTQLVADHLRKLRTAGFSTALDDFGTGYSSVGYLEQMSFDTLKIDRAFVQGVRDSGRRRAVLRAMIDMAHGLGLSVVGEGVETDEDLVLLRELGCDLVQGYHLGPPMHIDALGARWLSGPVPAQLAV